MVEKLNFDPRLILTSPASETEIREAEDKLSCYFPASYKEFLQLSNGAEGFVGDKGYIALWPVEKIEPNRIGFQFDKNLQNLIPIGSNGGSEAFVIRYLGNSVCFGFIQFSDSDASSFIPLDEDFFQALKLFGEGHAFD